MANRHLAFGDTYMASDAPGMRERSPAVHRHFASRRPDALVVFLSGASNLSFKIERVGYVREDEL